MVWDGVNFTLALIGVALSLLGAVLMWLGRDR